MSSGARRMYDKIRVLPCGDSALLVELGNDINPEVHRRVRNLFLTAEKEGLPGVVDMVPTYRSVLIYYDPRVTNLGELHKRLETLSLGVQESPVEKPRVVEIPMVYGGEYGPDLDSVAEHNGLTPQEVINIHVSTDYLVYMIGFSPGFPYLGGMSENIATPRLKTPRLAIPAGSVGIAERQTGIYPQESPGGWRLIGRTSLRLFDANREPPSLLSAGDYLRFIPINAEAYRTIQQQVEAGQYQVREHPAE